MSAKKKISMSKPMSKPMSKFTQKNQKVNYFLSKIKDIGKQRKRLQESFENLQILPDEFLIDYKSPIGNFKVSGIFMSKTITFYDDSDYEIIDDGGFNTIYEIKSGGNKGKALRINNKPLSKQEVYYLINEYNLTLKLSALGISPKVYDIFIMKDKTEDIYYSVMITEVIKNNLENFLLSKQLSEDMIKNLAKQTHQLYKRMTNNYIFCTDVKSKNMLVDEHNRVYTIDFDTDFCYNNEENPKKFFSLLKQKNIPLNKAINGFRATNILQVALTLRYYNPDNNNIALFSRYLVKKFINSDDFKDLFLVLTTHISNRTHYSKPILMLKHYLNIENIPLKISNDHFTLIAFIYAICVYGFKNAIDLILQANLERFNEQNPEYVIRKDDEHDKIIYLKRQSEPPNNFLPYLTSKDFSENIFINKRTRDEESPFEMPA